VLKLWSFSVLEKVPIFVCISISYTSILKIEMSSFINIQYLDEIRTPTFFSTFSIWLIILLVKFDQNMA